MITMDNIYSYYTQLPLLEWCGVITALFYVFLAAYKNIWCWPAALISTALYAYVFYDVYLWMDSLLQVYYIFMALYGWYCWNKAEDNLSQDISIWPWLKHFKICVIGKVVCDFGISEAYITL